MAQNIFIRWLGCGCLLLMVGSRSVLAGPPLVIDDPGIVPVGEWQYIVSMQGESRPSGDSAQVPNVEATYGFYDDMNITLIASRQYLDLRGESGKAGWGNAGINYKWLFYENDSGVSVAISPIYSFPLSRTSRRRGLLEDLRVFSMPVIPSWETGRWQFVASLAYDLASDGIHGVSYGAFALHNTTDRLQLMGEVYGAELSGDDFEEGSFTNWRLGALWYLGKGFSLLGAYGGQFHANQLARQDRLDYDFFLGVQYDTELVP